jgi:hypothetical protein
MKSMLMLSGRDGDHVAAHTARSTRRQSRRINPGRDPNPGNPNRNLVGQ